MGWKINKVDDASTSSPSVCLKRSHHRSLSRVSNLWRRTVACGASPLRLLLSRIWIEASQARPSPAMAMHRYPNIANSCRTRLYNTVASLARRATECRSSPTLRTCSTIWPLQSRNRPVMML